MKRWGVDYAALEADHGLPPGLLYAVEMTESRGNPEAVSPAGATGAFQFMPATAKELGVDPYSPSQSAVGAAKYLGMLTRRYRGDVEKALAAYNWGMGRVDKGLDNMPAETREYIPKVLNRINDGIEPWALYSQPDQAAPEAPSGNGSDIAEPWTHYRTEPASPVPAVRDPDVPAGVGEAGYSQRDPDVPYAPPALQPGDPDVPVPGAPDEYQVPWESSRDTPVAPGLALVHPSARPTVESLARGLTDPVGSDYQNLGAFLPEDAQRAAFGGRTLTEIEAAGERRYQSQRDPGSLDLARGGASVVPLMMFQGSILPRSRHLPQTLQNMAGGFFGAGMVPAAPTPVFPHDPDKPSYGLSPEQVELLHTRSAQGVAGAAGGALGGLAGAVLPRVAGIIPGLGPVVRKAAQGLATRTAAARGAIAGNLLSGSTPAEAEPESEQGPWDLYKQPASESGPWEFYQ
ncbi:lytic transglycosylase domain-containing protein [Azotobacter chroococcum]|uniref:lytic transglycosylase domain-containing protein n=1 Tax=Azotobacter chroococcum TaxID=353 RepID=UPI0010AE4C21|nr:lytic transglycosylase domain-containing protein [Azotobacter chroococcum]TKD39933.1 hypothetical protein FCG41_11915 [Azotobacter chroococcum]